MSNKNIKVKEKKSKKTKTNSGDVPTFKSPANTVWGKIVIIFLVSAMVFGIVFSLIYALLNP